MDEIYILSLPEANKGEFMGFMNNLRPVAEKHNIIVVPTKVKSVKIEELERWARAMLEDVLDLKKKIEGGKK